MDIVRREFNDSPYGMQCVFVALDNKWGIKLYFDQDKRDQCYQLQEECLDHGLAPELGDIVDLPSGFYCYGYITEIAQIVAHNDSDGRIWEMRNSEDVQDLIANLYKCTGWQMIDNHYQNFGYVNNCLVPIDFGDEDGYNGFTGKQSNNFEDIEQEMMELCTSLKQEL